MSAPIPTDLKLFQAATMGTSLSTPNIGGGLGTQITSGQMSSVFFPMQSDPVVTLKQTSNIKYEQASVGGGTLIGGGIYLSNSIANVITSGPLSFSSSSASDDTSVKIRCYTIGSGVGQTEDVQMNGLTPVSMAASVDTGASVLGLDLRGYSSSLIVSGGAVGSITIKDAGGNILGVIPAPTATSPAFWSAIGCVTFVLDTTLNTTGTVATPATLPSPTPLAKPNTPGSATAVPATMADGDYITIWPVLTLPPTAPAIPDWQMGWTLQGSAAA